MNKFKKNLFDPEMGTEQLQSLWIGVDSGVMTIKGEDSIFLKAPGLEPHHLAMLRVGWK